MAKEAEIELRSRISTSSFRGPPLLADMNRGPIHLPDLYNAGEWRCLPKRLLDAGCFTATRYDWIEDARGRTLNGERGAGQEVVRKACRPHQRHRGLRILKGNRRPKDACSKRLDTKNPIIAMDRPSVFAAKKRQDAAVKGEIRKGDVVRREV